MASAILLASAVGVLLYVLLSKNRYPAPLGGALGAAAVATFFGLSLWITLPIVAIIAITGYLLIHGGIKRWIPATVGTTAVATVIAIAAAATLTGGAASLAHANDTPDSSVIQALTVTTVPKEAECTTNAEGVVPWDVPAINLTAPGRVWPDSIMPPFTTSDPAQVRAQVLQTNCTNPNYGVMNANAFANLVVGGVKVVDLNPWLKSYAGTGNDLIATKAAAFMPLLNVKTPTDAQKAAAPQKNRDYQEFIAKVNTLILRLFIDGTHSDQSIVNYHLLVGGLTAGLPMITINDHQENLPAVQFYLANKGQKGCILKVGYNTGDRRWEQFGCATTPGPGPSTTPTTPGTPTHPGTTPPGGCKSGCVTTPPTSPPTTPTPSPSCTQYTSSQKGTCYGGKTSASPAPGVGNPTMTNPGSISNTPPPTKSTPLQPQPSGGHTTQPTAPDASPVPSYNPPPPNTGAPNPSQAPTTMPCPPGVTTC